MADVTVAIVGAGVSGLACASRLFAAGITSIILFEAKDRSGGRMFSVPFGDYNVELGAQWIHGVEGNVAFEIANELGNGKPLKQLLIVF